MACGDLCHALCRTTLSKMARNSTVRQRLTTKLAEQMVLGQALVRACCESAGFASLSQTLSKPWSKNARSDKGCDEGCRQSFQLRRLLQQPCRATVSPPPSPCLACRKSGDMSPQSKAAPRLGLRRHDVAFASRPASA